MLSTFLNKLFARENLTQAEAAALLDGLLGEEATDARIAAALIALAMKGETEAELAGFAETMRSRAARITTSHQQFIDTCGTGGSAVKTFNVSTAAAFVVSAAGLPVAKHGNVGVTSKSGSADVLRALGIKVELGAQRVSEIFDEIGLCFMFAPLHHAATKRVAMIRRELGVRTIFNLLGPLTNPAAAPFQLIGVADDTACEKVAGALARLGTQRAWVVRGADGLDEITLTCQSAVYEVSRDGVRRFDLTPQDFGLDCRSIEGICCASAEENARAIRDLLEGRSRDAARDLLLINAAAALRVAGISNDLKQAIKLAAQAIDSGAAAEKLESLRRLSHQNPQP